MWPCSAQLVSVFFYGQSLEYFVCKSILAVAFELHLKVSPIFASDTLFLPFRSEVIRKLGATDVSSAVPSRLVARKVTHAEAVLSAQKFLAALPDCSLCWTSSSRFLFKFLSGGVHRTGGVLRDPCGDQAGGGDYSFRLNTLRIKFFISFQKTSV